MIKPEIKKLKKGQKITLPATYEGETEDGLAIVSIGTIDNYVLTLDHQDLTSHASPKKTSAFSE